MSNFIDWLISHIKMINTFSHFRQQEPRFPINIGITGYVAKTGEVRNFSYYSFIENGKVRSNCVFIGLKIWNVYADKYTYTHRNYSYLTL